MPKIIPTGVFKHYKGGLYQVLGVAQHTETDELLVIYVALTGAELPGPRMRARPLNGPEGFTTNVLVDGNSVYRFQYLGLEVPK